MVKREYTQARAEANRRSDKANGKRYMFYLRLNGDEEIIKSIEDAQAQGINKTEWLRKLFWEKNDQ